MQLLTIGSDGTDPLRVLKLTAALGESPWWSVREQALYWVDTLAPSVSRFKPVISEHQSWRMPDRIGCISLCDDGSAIVALRSGIALFDLAKGKMGTLHRPPAMSPDLHFNDGKCDRSGRFWVGAHFGGVPKQFVGSLFRFDPDFGCEERESGIGISNGLGWSPDLCTLYYVDSLARCIYAYDFECATGRNFDRRIFATAQSGCGVPDGLTVDSAGFVWCAHWDGWCVVRYARDGTIDRVVRLPVQRPTSCMFGGPDLRTLFITSARHGIEPDALERQPLAGSIFALELTVPGLPEPTFARSHRT